MGIKFNPLTGNFDLVGAAGEQGPAGESDGRAMYVTVAASDAPADMIAAADYTCDGTNDEVQIQEAIDAVVLAGGGTVELSQGTFSVSDTIEIIAHSVSLKGQGVDATQITSTAATFVGIQMGDRQTDDTMRNWMGLFDLTYSHAGGASDYACIQIDGGGSGTTIQRVQTNEGKYGFDFIDLDRCYFNQIDANNYRTAGIRCATGLENTWGTVTFVNPSMASSDEDSICWLWETHSTQESPNRFDRITVIGGLLFATSDTDGTVGLKMTVGASSMVFIGTLFESPKLHHVWLTDETGIKFEGVTFIQNSGVTTNGFYLENDNHKITIDSCRFQQMTNVFNGASGFSQLTFQGLSENQGTITNLFTGSFGAKFGTDVLFAGDDALVAGGDNERYNKVQQTYSYFKETGSAPSTSSGKHAMFVSSNAQLVFKDEDGDEFHIQYGPPALTVAASNAPTDIKRRSDYVCDGTADDVQIQAAIDAAGGGKVQLSQGTFSLAATVEIDDNTVLEGQGKNSTILQLASSVNASMIRTPTGGSSHVFFVTIRGIGFDGNKANNTDGDAIDAAYAHTWLVEDVFIKDTAGHGVNVSGSSGAIALNNVFRNCRIQDTASGKYNLVFGAFSPNNHIQNCIFGSSTGEAAVGLLNDENTMVGCHISGGGTNGLKISGSNNIVMGNFVEASSDDGIYISDNVGGNRIEGNVIFNSGFDGAAGTYAGIRVAGDDNALIGNQCFDRQGTKTQDYGIVIESTGTRNLIAHNTLLENGTGEILDQSSTTIYEITPDTITRLTADATPDGATDYVVTYDASASALKKVLLDNLPGGSGGTGDVVGPASATDEAIARFDTTTGELLQDSPSALLDDDSNLTLTDPTDVVLDDPAPGATITLEHTKSGTGTSSYKMSQTSYDVLRIQRDGDTTGDGESWSLVDIVSPVASEVTELDSEATLSLTTYTGAGGSSVSRTLDVYNDDYSRDHGMGMRQLHKNNTANPIRFELHDKTTSNGAFVLAECYGVSAGMSFTSIDSEATGVTPEVDDWIWDNGGLYFADDTKITSITLNTPSAGITTYGVNRALLDDFDAVSLRGKNIKEIMRLTPDRQLLVRKFIADDTDNVAEFGGDIEVDGVVLDATKQYKVRAGNLASDDRLIFEDLGSSANSRYWFDSASGSTGISIAEGGTERVYAGTDSGDFMFETKSTYGIKFRTQSGAERLKIDTAGGIVVNDNGDAIDVRIEGDTDANLLFTDGSTDRVGIGTDTPSTKLHVVGNVTTGQLLLINATSGNPEFDFQESGTTRAKTYYDVTNNRLTFQNNENNNADAIYFADPVTTTGNMVLGGALTAVGSTLTGVNDAGGATSFEIPNGTSPTVDAAGEIAIDTDADGNLVDQGLIVYHDGTQKMFVPAVDTLTSTDNAALTYDAASDKFVFETVTAGAGGSTTQVQYNSSGSLAGMAEVTWSNTDKQLLITENASQSETVFRVQSNDTTQVFQVSPVNNQAIIENIRAQYSWTSATTTPFLQVMNTTNDAGADAGMFFRVQTGAATTEKYTLGIDRTDTKFKISDADALGTNDRLTIDSTGLVVVPTLEASTSLEVPNGAGGTTVDAAGEVCVDTTSATLNFHDGTAERVLTPIKSKSITIEDPSNAEDISMFYTDDAITITKIVAVCVGSTPSVTWTLRHHTDRSNTGNEVVTSGTTTTSTTTGSVVTSFNDATVPADSFLWVETTAASGTIGSINITVFYRQDA